MTRPALIAALILMGVAIGPATAHAQASRLVILVRHAEASGEPQRDPGLTERGRERAEALASALRHTEIGAIIVSGLQRTHLTAQPAAAARGLAPTVVETSGGIEAHVRGVAEAVRAAPAGEAVLVVGHSNTIPRIIHALGGPALGDLCHAAFRDLFILELREREPLRLIQAEYGPEDEAAAAGCEPRAGPTGDW